MKKDKSKALLLLKENLLWILGCLLYSVAVNALVLPNHLAQSGMTGASVILHRLFGLPVGAVGFLLNLPLLFLMWKFLGKTSLAKTLWVSVILSLCLDGVAWLFANYLPVYTGDKILASLICGVLEGSGLGIIMTTGATSGGTDIIGKLINKRWPHISVGTIVMAADGIIVTAYMIVFRSLESGLYALIVAFVSTRVIDALIYGTGNGKCLMIFTKKADEVSKAMISNSPRGVSIIPAKGAYSGEDNNMLICVARKSEIRKLIKIVKSIDNQTFIIVSEANEILGNGFNTDF